MAGWGNNKGKKYLNTLEHGDGAAPRGIARASPGICQESACWLTDMKKYQPIVFIFHIKQIGKEKKLVFNYCLAEMTLTVTLSRLQQQPQTHHNTPCNIIPCSVGFYMTSLSIHAIVSTSVNLFPSPAMSGIFRHIRPSVQDSFNTISMWPWARHTPAGYSKFPTRTPGCSN